MGCDIYALLKGPRILQTPSTVEAAICRRPPRLRRYEEGGHRTHLVRLIRGPRRHGTGIATRLQSNSIARQAGDGLINHCLPSRCTSDEREFEKATGADIRRVRS